MSKLSQKKEDIQKKYSNYLQKNGGFHNYYILMFLCICIILFSLCMIVLWMFKLIKITYYCNFMKNSESYVF